MDKTTLDGAQAPAENPRLLFDKDPGSGIVLGMLDPALQKFLVPTGVILPYGGASAPGGFLLCDGSAVSRLTYAALFKAIGTAYGVGDGSTTFNLPDLRGRVPVGKNAGTFTTLGATGGEETHILVTAEMPSHTHVQNAHNHAITDPAHGHQERGGTGSGSTQQHASTLSTYSSSVLYGTTETGTSATGITINNTTPTNQNTGNDGAHNNLQPYQVVNYIVKV